MHPPVRPHHRPRRPTTAVRCAGDGFPITTLLLIAAVLAAALLGAAAARAGEITPGLTRILATTPPNEPVRVLVVMEEQADIATLDLDLKAAKATRAHRHRVVVERLREIAARSQPAVRASLEAAKAGGGVLGLHPHWLVNAFVVTATPEAVRRIAAREDVALVEPDLVIDLIEPVAPMRVKTAKTEGIGVALGVKAVWADRVWHELGIDGSGALVGVIDSGVDGHHPALAARWRGNFAPTEECWLDGADLGDPIYPEDHHFHGTHVMGTICGVAPDDTIGVAPGALWIATNAINQNVGPEYDSAVLAALEFMADPDGDPATIDDVPDVVQNSWGVNEFMQGYLACDSRWWNAIDNCEAAGVVLTWSAGNEGPNPGSMRSPADRSTSGLNAFSVGAVDASDPFQAADFSSRGPTTCGGAHALKPELVAPGVDVYSSIPGGDYAYASGTSMAGPHVAGVVALMRSANPNLEVEEIKQILLDTCKDLGPAGEDGDTGHGMLNAFDAVKVAMGGYREVTGRMTDAATGEPIVNGCISTLSGSQKVFSGPEGGYELLLPEGGNEIVWEAFGYEPRMHDIDVRPENTGGVDITLAPIPVVEISGVVRTLGTLPVAEAEVAILGTPLEPASTDAAGWFAIEVPVRASYDVQARAAGLGADQFSLYVDRDHELDFDLPLLELDDFELGHFGSYPWTHAGDEPWIIDNAMASSGVFSARTGDIGVNTVTELSVTVDVISEGEIRFNYLLSTEQIYDIFTFLVDGEVSWSWSGIQEWETHTHQVGVGRHTFTWRYEKDGSVDMGADAIWIDEVEFPALGEIPTPTLTMEQSAVSVILHEGATASTSLRFGNQGPGDLIWSAAATAGAPVVRDPEWTPPPKGRPAPARPAGGDKVDGIHDAYGYTWSIDLEPDGPTFAWIEPPDAAPHLDTGDDGNVGPLPLGFRMPFYGHEYDRIYVCSNGWLSFTSRADDYSVADVPSAAAPDAVIAPFWTDLNPLAGGAITAHPGPDGNSFVVTWKDVPRYPDGLPESFQAILHDDGSILMQYERVSENRSQTVGIENADGSIGLLVLRDIPLLSDGRAILVEHDPPPDRWLVVQPPSGELAPWGIVDLDLVVDARDMTAGQYAADLVLTTNDTDNAVVHVPVDVTVLAGTGVDGPAAARVGIATITPNPFNPQTTVVCELPPGGAHLDLRVFDAAGRRVRTLHAGPAAGGELVVRWDARDDAGRDLPSGTYLLRLRAGDVHEVRKLALLR